MKEISEYEKDLASIRTMMERSVKFLSLSGLSGVLAGFYALVGSAGAYFLIYYPAPPIGYGIHSNNRDTVLGYLVAIALGVLVLSLITGYAMSLRKAKKLGVSIWNPASRQLLLDIGIPLLSGGLFMAILVMQGYFGIVAPACLVFYGLALIQGGRSTFEEIKYLGLTEIALGLVCAILPGYGLIFWAIGFGVMHVMYGALMYFRYDR